MQSEASDERRRGGRGRRLPRWSSRRPGHLRAAPRVEALEGRLLLSGAAPTAVGDNYTTLVGVPLAVPAPGVLQNDTDPESDPLTAANVASPAHGMLAFNSDGSFTYTPAAGFHGLDSFTYKANDGTSDSNVATVSIVVDTPPVAVGDSYSTAEDTPLNVAAPGVLGNDTDADGDTLSPLLITDVSHGSLTLNNDGSFTYTPDANYNGPDSFSYRASDGLAVSNLATVSLSVTAVNDAPQAVDDSFSTAEDTPLNVAAPGVLGNDSDAEGDSFTALVVSGPAHGMLTLNPNGSFTYTPDANYNGPDSFTYRDQDASDQGNVATVSLTVTPVNDAPVAVDDSHATDEDTPLSIGPPGVLGNDTDVDGDTLTATLVAGPAHGMLTLNPNGSFTYTPVANYNGPDSFTYRAEDGSLQSNIATVSLTVNPVNDAPVAVDDAYPTAEDTPLSIPAPGILGNDTDVESDPLVAELVAGPAHGMLVFGTDGSFTYTPAANYNGPDSFTYRAKDASLSSGIATVSLTVTPVNDAPVAVDDAYSTAEDTALSITPPGILANDTDVEGTALSPILVSTTAHGVLNLSVDGSFTYTPAANYNGPDSFTYRVTDGAAMSNVATVTLTVTPVNDAPVAVDDSYTTAEDTPLTIAAPGVLNNDTDVEGNTLSIATVPATGPSHGTVTLNPDGSFTYTPAANYHGPDSFTYHATDGNAVSNLATVSLTVTPVNDAPVAVNDAYSTPQDAALEIAAPGVLGNDTDADGDALSAILVSGPANGGLTFNSNGSFRYAPAAGFHGADSFTYRITDGTAQSNVGTVDLTVIRPNIAPVAGDTVFSTDQGTTLTAPAPGVLKNASDADGDPLTATQVAGPAHGTLALNPDGSFTYAPAAGFHGTDSFTIRASDGRDVSNVATVTVVVSAPNSVPVAHEDAYAAAVGTTLNVAAPGVLANDTDADGDPIFALLVSAPTHGSLVLNVDGSFSYTPAAGFAGADSFTYRASDVSAQSIPVLVTITVGEVRPAVTAFGLAGNDTGVVGDGITRNNTPGFAGLAPAGDLVQLLVKRQGTNSFVPVGQVRAGSDGAYTVLSNALTDGTYQFRVTATRQGASSPEAALTLGSLVIDRTPPRISGILFQPRQGRFLVSFTEAINRLNVATALNRLNYQFTRVLDNGRLQNLPVTSVVLASASQVQVNVNAGRRLTAGRYNVTVGSGGVFDLAGNSLDGEFRGPLPSGNGTAGGNFRARLIYNGRVVLGPLALPGARA